MTTKKRPRESFTLADKYYLIEDKLSGMSTEDLQKKYHLKNRSNVNRIWNNKDKVISAYESGTHGIGSKSLKTTKNQVLDSRLAEYVNRHFLTTGEQLPQKVILEQARDLAAELNVKGKFTAGYFNCFKKRQLVMPPVAESISTGSSLWTPQIHEHLEVEWNEGSDSISNDWSQATGDLEEVQPQVKDCPTLAEILRALDVMKRFACYNTLETLSTITVEKIEAEVMGTACLFTHRAKPPNATISRVSTVGFLPHSTPTKR